MSVLMDLGWLDPAQLERRDVDGAVAVLVAARAADAPGLWLPTIASYVARLRHGGDGDPPVAAVARDGTGRVVGVLEVSLPRWDNTHLGSVEVTVDPNARRHGLGRRLFEVGAQRVRADGRTLLVSTCFDRPAAVEFSQAMGLERAYEEVHWCQDLTTLDWARLDREYQQARSQADGYELLRLPGAVPEGMLAQVVEMTAAINDAPTGDLAVEDQVYSVERIRAFEAGIQARQARTYRLVARERATGALAGLTQLLVPADVPWEAGQLDTSVLRAHRGHRLGILLKIAMLYWLREEEPQLRLIYTQNATSNAHMVRVNELLGYRPVVTHIEWQRRLRGSG